MIDIGDYWLEIFKASLLNVFFIMIPVAFYQVLLREEIKKKAMHVHMLTYLFFAVPMVLCLHFRINISEYGLVYDMRSVPFILASYYGGPIPTVFMYLTLVGYRALFGGIGAYSNVVSATITFLILYMTFKKFQTLTLIKKMCVAALAALISKTIGMVAYSLMDSSFNAQVFFMSEASFIFQCIVLGISIYLLEVTKKNTLLADEVIKSEKIKIISELSAAVAHEIRNPLTSVRGFIQLLKESNVSEEKRSMYANISLEELDRAQNIISDYLSLAKPEFKKVEHIPVSEEIEYIVNVLTSYANMNDVVIETYTPYNIRFLGDKAKFKQCLINILKNAIEAMPEGGLLEITAQKDKDHKHANITISDTGLGMSKLQVERLGTPYYSTKEKGTGLGMMVSYSIVRQMGGTISVFSEEGRGTKFLLTFPITT